MNFGFIMIFLFMLTIYGGIHYYIGIRGLEAFGKVTLFLNYRIYWGLIWILALAFIIGRLGGGRLPVFLSHLFTRIGAYWMGIMVYLLFILMTIDLIRAINNKINILPIKMTSMATFSFRVGIVVLIILWGIIGYGIWNARSPRVVDYKVQINKNLEGLEEVRMVVVSDLHLGLLVGNRHLEKMIDQINELQPDIVLMPGDIIDDRIEPFIRYNMAERLQRLSPRLGVYASMGNHEYIGGHGDQIEEELTRAGIRVLRDEIVQVEGGFYVAGREDHAFERFSSQPRKSLQEILIDVDKELPIILLDHQPNNLEEARIAGVDLQVSGHTHRGQLFPFHLITSRIFEIDRGHLQRGNFHAIVTSGYGTWGPPIRLGSRSEIVNITLKIGE